MLTATLRGKRPLRPADLALNGDGLTSEGNDLHVLLAVGHSDCGEYAGRAERPGVLQQRDGCEVATIFACARQTG